MIRVAGRDEMRLAWNCLRALAIALGVGLATILTGVFVLERVGGDEQEGMNEVDVRIEEVGWKNEKI